MNILVFNCGSSSLNYKFYQVIHLEDMHMVVKGKAHRVGVVGSEPAFVQHEYAGETYQEIFPFKNHHQAATHILVFLKEHNLTPDCIGHRFVHGRDIFDKPVWYREEIIDKLETCHPLAPIHNPNSLSVIHACQEALGSIDQYLAFDSSFHASLPAEAYTYAIPQELAWQFGFRRYGFHGLSYQYVLAETVKLLGKAAEELRIVGCHLGTGGSSLAAIDHGHSIDTTMGFSPTSGVMMSTRSGDIDPMLLLYLLRSGKEDAKSLGEMLNKHSGLLGVSGISSDIRDILADIDKKQSEQAQLAFDMYVHIVKKFIGAYITLMGGCEALVFTDDIGFHNWRVREAICACMEWCGIALDQQKNAAPVEGVAVKISAETSRVPVFIMPTDEELVIAQAGVSLFQELDRAAL